MAKNLPVSEEILSSKASEVWKRANMVLKKKQLDEKKLAAEEKERFAAVVTAEDYERDEEVAPLEFSAEVMDGED